MWLPNAVVLALTVYFMRRVGRDQAPLPSMPGLGLLRSRGRRGTSR